MNNAPYIASLLKTFDILDCFADDRQELSISEIADIRDLPISSVYRIVQSLEFEGMLIQNRETRKYALGSGILAFSRKSSRYEHFVQIAAGYADKLCKLTGETVNLAICAGDCVTIIYHAESPHILRPYFPLTRSYPAHCTGVGRVFLSHMDDSALKWIHASINEETSGSTEDFLSMLHKTRREGYALDDQEFNAGLRCVAAPVYSGGGKVLFALSICAPVARMNDEAYKKACQLVLQYAHSISQEIQSA